MQIHGLQSNSAIQPASRSSTPKAASPVPSTPAVNASADQLDLSAEAQQIGEAQAASASNGAIRADRVAELRQAIASGTYETPEKMSAAIDKMLDTFA